MTAEDHERVPLSSEAHYYPADYRAAVDFHFCNQLAKEWLSVVGETTLMDGILIHCLYSNSFVNHSDCPIFLTAPWDPHAPP